MGVREFVGTEADVDKAVPRPLQALGRIMNALYYLAMGLAIFGLLIIVGVVSWQVFSRYVASTGAPWAPELSQITFVWTALFAIAIGVRQGRHMSINAFAAVKSKMFNVIMDTISTGVVVWVSYILVTNAIDSLSISFNRVFPALGIAVGWMQLALPVGFTLCALFAVEVWARGVFDLPAAVKTRDQDAGDLVEVAGESTETGVAK